MGREISFFEVEDFSGGYVENFFLEYDGKVNIWRDGDDSGGNRIEWEDSEFKVGSIMRDLDFWMVWFYKFYIVMVFFVGVCFFVYVFCFLFLWMEEISGCFLSIYCYVDSCRNFV